MPIRAAGTSSRLTLQALGPIEVVLNINHLADNPCVLWPAKRSILVKYPHGSLLISVEGEVGYEGSLERVRFILRLRDS